MNFKITDLPLEQEKAAIFQELLQYNLARIENKDVKELGIFLEDESGGKVAGLIGDTHGNWLEIEYLWVNEENRGQNIGTELMNKAEAVAKERGCKYVFLNTFSFQAPQFYKKLGYKEVFALNDYPLTGKRYYYTKKI